jgi:voltage-gated potassium channel
MTTSNDLSAMNRRDRWHTVIFEADTKEGRVFDVVLIALILLSVVIVGCESIESIRRDWGFELRVMEWVVTAVFTVEYIARLLIVRKRLSYAVSFYGTIDLLAILPSYLSLALGGVESLLVIRVLRLFRVFRIFRFLYLIRAARQLDLALRAAVGKLTVFLGVVMTLVVLIGGVMYVIEGEQSGFTSIPQSCYWTIVTMTTVGYGDIVPQTDLGRFIASIVMILGYALIAVPTGIVTVELTKAPSINTQACPDCGRGGHDDRAKHCMHCGSRL